jgi:hypothetical protein
MFQHNDELLQLYSTRHPESVETLVDFGMVPQDAIDRTDWEAEVTRFLQTLAGRGYQFQAAMEGGDSGLCPLYAVRLDRGDFNGPTPVDLSYFQWVVDQLCHKAQKTEVRGRILDIHVLGDGQSLDELFGHAAPH